MNYKSKNKLIIILLLCCISTTLPAFAYIDPNTGAMLFSLLLCSITSIFFIFNSLILKIKTRFFSKSLSTKKHDFVIYSEGNQYFCVFKPILDEFEKRKINLTYYTSSKNDPVFSKNYNYIKSEYIGKNNTAYFKLAFLNADICLLTTPHLDVFQLKRSKNTKHYCHIFHSISFSMNYRLFALDYFDSVLCDAKFQIPLIREIEKKRNLPSKKLAVVGSTYMDYNKKRLDEIKTKPKNDKFTILIAPSWGRFSLLNKFGKSILEDFKNTEYKIIIRPHPQSLRVDKKLIDDLITSTKNSKNISWDFDSDNLKSLSKADILISDFSCIMMDYAFLFNKPFLYLKTDIVFDTLDCSDLDETAWRYKILDEIGKELKPQNGDIENLKNIIEEMKNNPNYEKNIINASNYAWEEKGNSAKNVVDFLIETQKELNNGIHI